MTKTFVKVMQNKHFIKMLDDTQTSRQRNPKEQVFTAVTSQAFNVLIEVHEVKSISNVILNLGNYTPTISPPTILPTTDNTLPE